MGMRQSGSRSGSAGGGRIGRSGAAVRPAVLLVAGLLVTAGAGWATAQENGASPDTGGNFGPSPGRWGESESSEIVLRIEVDMVRYVTLPGNADTVYVANPDIVDINPINRSRVFVLAKRPGQTNIIALTSDSELLMNLPVVVIPQTGRAVTFNRGSEEQIEHVCGPRCIALEKRKERNVSARQEQPQEQQAGAAMPGAVPGGSDYSAEQGAGGDSQGRGSLMVKPLVPPTE